MRLTVLGNAARYLAPLSGGSSYLVEADDARILLDAGGGAREALARSGFDGTLDAVVLSHFHHDHVLEFPTLRAALSAETLVVVPPGEAPRLSDMARLYAFRGDYDLPGKVVEAAPEKKHRVKDATLSFAPTRHSAPSFATRIACGGAVLVYAGDSTPCESLATLAGGADLLLMHTLLPTVDADSSHAARHATAQTAAALAVEAGAKRLMLSHRYWESLDAAMREAARAHPQVVLAETMRSWDVVTGTAVGTP